MNPRVRRILPFVGLALVVVIGVVGFNIYWDSAHFVSTDNAQVSGQPVSVGSINAGRVVSVNTAVGAAVHKDDLLAEVALPTSLGLSQNGTPKMEFLGDADVRVAIRSPMDGVVIAVPSPVGSTVGQGQAVVTLIDPTQLWVNANVDETKIEHVRVGQDVEVHIDASNQNLAGHVSAVTPATASTFSLLPQSNTTSNFTKVTQVVPVRITLNVGSQPRLLGSSASVRVHIG